MSRGVLHLCSPADCNDDLWPDLMSYGKNSMDNSFHQQESNNQQKSGFLASLQIFDSILPLMRHSLNWLAGLIKLTKEEQENAGVYPGRLGDE
jgi:hypothetical protein